MHGRRVCPDVRADTKGGRSSIAPEKLVRGLLLEVLYSIRSERMLMEQRDVPSANCAKRLRQCPREIVDLVHAVMQFRAPSPGLSDAPPPRDSHRSRAWCRNRSSLQEIAAAVQCILPC
jgi:hypothetical protein